MSSVARLPHQRLRIVLGRFVATYLEVAGRLLSPGRSCDSKGQIPMHTYVHDGTLGRSRRILTSVCILYACNVHMYIKLVLISRNADQGLARQLIIQEPCLLHRCTLCSGKPLRSVPTRPFEPSWTLLLLEPRHPLSIVSILSPVMCTRNGTSCCRENDAFCRSTAATSRYGGARVCRRDSVELEHFTCFIKTNIAGSPGFQHGPTSKPRNFF